MALAGVGQAQGAPALVPVLPAVPDCPGWRTALGALGAEHLARALLAPDRLDAPPPFRVLDGLWYPVRGHRWRRVDQGYLVDLFAGWRASADPRRPAALAVLQRAAVVLLDQGPMGLRRLVLWQLAELLLDQGDPTEAAAVRLGVHPAEAAQLAAATAARGAVDRDAAEGLLSACQGRRLRAVGALLDRLPRDAGDQLLDAVRSRYRADLDERDGLLDEAEARAGRGDLAGAVRSCLWAARLDHDDPRPAVSLVRIQARADRPGDDALVCADLLADGVRLNWRSADRQRVAGAEVRYRVLREAAGTPGGPVEVATVAGHELHDTSVRHGTAVRYAVLPVAAGRVVGGAHLSRRVAVAPPVTGLRPAPARRSVELHWDAPAAAAELRVVRTTEPGPGPDSGRDSGPVRTLPRAAHPTGLLDTDVDPGRYRYAVACGYRAPDGSLLWSAAASATAVVEEYPDPVESVRLSPGPGGTVTVDWPAPAHGRSRLVVWGGGPLPAPGTELPSGSPDRFTEAAPATVDGAGRVRAEVTPARGGLGSYLVVSTLGARTVAGRGVLVDASGTVEDLKAERYPDGRTRLTFDWPDPAVQVEVGWTQGGATQQRTVARSSYLRDGLLLPTDARSGRITVAPVGRAGADLVLAGAGELQLAPCLRIAWKLARPVLRRDRPWQVEITAAARPEPDPAGRWPYPDFLLVAGEGTLRPLRPEQGRELLRVPGARLAHPGPCRAALDLRGLTRPAVLRAFLLGPHAAAAQLQDPNPDTLVVR
jgi:hypothetical protein